MPDSLLCSPGTPLFWQDRSQPASSLSLPAGPGLARRQPESPHTQLSTIQGAAPRSFPWGRALPLSPRGRLSRPARVRRSQGRYVLSLIWTSNL
ncbi:hypothetical protein C2E23DRAFT_312370 [Lenzites betulinus]|nr:hypothetical protein C2E23DRAFT_312370 [Lenzites betulinus]